MRQASFQRYTNVAFSKHARERMELRVISDDMVLATIQNPDRAYLEDDGDTKFTRKVNGVELHVVCMPLPDEDKWLVKSTWVRGEDDAGYRVDRNGRRIGQAKRSQRQSKGAIQPRRRFVSVDVLLLVFLIALVIVLIYLLAR